jgi:hypothetical protein
MSVDTFYILVKKIGNTFEIIEDNSNIQYGKPSELISSANEAFPIIVIKKSINNFNSSGNNFTVGTGDNQFEYTLELDTITNQNNIGTKITADTFKTMQTTSAGGNAVQKQSSLGDNAAREQSFLENITVNNGGQKQKQQKSKRNYSKKRRSSKSKSDTLRNYFNYDHLQ